MSASKLVKPATRYKESFLGAIKEFHKEDRYLFINPEDIAESFEGFVNDLNNGKRHMHQPFENWVEPVPETTLWFVKDEHFIGTLNIRHRLNWHLEKWGGHISFNIRPSMRGQGFGKKILQKATRKSFYVTHKHKTLKQREKRHCQKLQQNCKLLQENLYNVSSISVI